MLSPLPYVATGAEDFTLSGEFMLSAARTEADPNVRVIILTQEMPIETARTRVQKADTDKRRDLAKKFVERLSDASDISEIWLCEVDTELRLALVMSDVSLDRELELRAVFAEFTLGQDADLDIYDESGSFDFEREGERLN